MNRKEFEERVRKNALDADFCDKILEQKIRMYQEGKNFYVCTVGNYQLIIIRISGDRFEHAFIPTLEFIKQVTEKDMGEIF